MIKLNPKQPGVVKYTPPFTVVPHYGDVDVSADIDTQIEQLLWIPAFLVSRFGYQFPWHLRGESDELFSIGLQQVVEVVTKGGLSGDKIGGVCNVKCRKAMENYANNLNRAVKVCTSTQYENLKRGKRTPTSGTIDGRQLFVEDNMSEIYVNEAANLLGIDLSNLSLKDKRRLQKVLSE